MYAKIRITGTIEVKTGMHIGGSTVFAAIGAVDAPVIRDARSNLPMIPGSSLKGKMRSLLAKEYNTALAKKPDDDAPRLLRLFGCAKGTAVKRSRVLVSDMFLCNGKELREQGAQGLTEVKFENSINRATAVANPRQIERVVRGAAFSLDIMYEAEKEDEIEEDFSTLAEGIRLLQYDYIGGSGSRGYGKIVFRELRAETVIGQVEVTMLGKCNELLQKAMEPGGGQAD